MKIEVGKWYVRRSGVPVKIARETKGVLFPFMDDTRTSYQANGKYFVGEGVHANDLVREWKNPDVGSELVQSVEAQFKPAPSLFDTMKAAGFKVPLTSPQIEAVTPTPQPATETAPKAHKHAAIIKAWADGQTIEYKGPEMTEWKTLLPAGHSMTQWKDDVEYRVKTESLKLFLAVHKSLYNGELFAGASCKTEADAWSSALNCRLGVLIVEFDRETKEVTNFTFKKEQTQ